MITSQPKSQPASAFSPAGNGSRKGPRKCNLCEAKFRPRTPFERFCQHCKEENELLRFVHWLPEVDDAIQSKMPA